MSIAACSNKPLSTDGEAAILAESSSKTSSKLRRESVLKVTGVHGPESPDVVPVSFSESVLEVAGIPVYGLESPDVVPVSFSEVTGAYGPESADAVSDTTVSTTTLVP